MHSSITPDLAMRVEPDLSIVIPALNEAAGIRACLGPLQEMKKRGAEIILADGGSTDQTVELARGFCDRIVDAPRGRGSQMNAGAGAARGKVLLFLHADTRLPDRADSLVRQAFAQEPSKVWGRFDVEIEGTAPLLRTIARAMSLRSRLSGIATGDQAIFCRRDAFLDIQGFPPLPIMEDIAFSHLMRRQSWPICLKARVTTSGRRWESHGVARTVLLMWGLRLGYALGLSASTLSAWYRYESSPDSSGPPPPANADSGKFMNPTCHIAVFSKAPVAGQVKTRLIPALGAQGAAQAHRRLLRYTLSVVHYSGYASSLWIAGEFDHPDLLGMSEAFGMPLRSQSGSDLGARMKAAMQDLLCTVDAAVIIGTDCPVLELRHLEQIFFALASGHEVAAIPAEDGGYVLIAMSCGEPGRRAQLLEALFDDMPWSTDRVMQLTRERLMAIDTAWFEMPPLWDVDDPDDFARFETLAEFPAAHTP